MQAGLELLKFAVLFCCEVNDSGKKRLNFGSQGQ